MVQKILAFLGGVFVLLCVYAALLYIGWGNISKSGSEYVAWSITSLSDKWDYKELVNRADPQMFAGHPESETIKTLEVISHLGKLKSLQGCEGEANLELANSHSWLSAQYVCKAQFEKDVAVATFILVRKYTDIFSLKNVFGGMNDDWKILKFNIASDYLLKPAQ